MYFLFKAANIRINGVTLTFRNQNSPIHILMLFVLLITGTANAQNSKIDSLKKELSLHTKKDTTRVNLLNALAFSHFSSDIAKSLEYLGEAETIAESIDFKKGKGRSIYIRGITEAIQSNFDQALRHYNEALKLYINIDFKQGVANCNNAIAITYKNKGDLRKSITYLKKAISIEEEIGGKNLSAALINLGSVYQYLGEFDKAVLPLKKALSIAKVDDNEQRVAYSLNNLGTVYTDQGNYPLALEHYRESLYINEKLSDSLGIANNLLNMGQIYKTQKNYNKAMNCYERSLEINKRINSKQGVSALLNDIGIIYEENGDYGSALDHYVDALDISKQIGVKSDVPYILNNIGGVYLTLEDYVAANQNFTESKKISEEVESKEALCGAYIGLAKSDAGQNNYNRALDNALKAQKISKTYGFLDYQKEALEILSRIYKATGNYKYALQSYQEFKMLNDSLFNKENIEKIAQIEYEYKYKQALDSANIRELKLTKTVLATSQDLARSNQNLLWAVIGILLISILLGSMIFYQKFRNIKVKNHNIITEQKLLRSQMNPHFVFNSLSVLQGMILNQEEKKSAQYLSKFSRLLRITLENSRDKMVLLSQELTAVENYMALQNLENDSYEFSIAIDEGIDGSLFKIPPMLIQPFIENAIEHAFVNQKEERKIEMHLKYLEGELICLIKDNGIGINSQKKNNGNDKKSLATQITSERLHILSSYFKMKGSVTIEDRTKYNEKGTMVTLVVPYKKLETA